MRAPRPALTPVLAPALLLVLTACTVETAAGSSAEPTVTTSTGTAADAVVDTTLAEEWTDAFDHITTCEDVGAATGGLTDGLELVAENVDDRGFLCGWATPAGTDAGTARTLEVAGEAIDLSGTMTSPEAIAAGKVLVHVPDPGLDAVGGIAYALHLDGAVSSLSVTVEVPDAELTVSGAGWGGAGLDETSAVRVATAVLGA